MKTDKYDNAILTIEEGKRVLLNGRDIEGAFIDDLLSDEVNSFCHNSEQLLGHKAIVYVPPINTMSNAMWHSEKTKRWHIPEQYKSIDVKAYLLDKCLDSSEEERILVEYVMFEERGLIPLLQTLIYIVDIMRENNIVWGVGRGSSVASYALYLIGVHKVNSMRYNLPIEEFLK